VTQIGESVSVIIDIGADKEECIFCQKAHQDEKAASAHEFPRDMSKLKKEGRVETIASFRSARYPSESIPPLVEWSKDIGSTGGYKAAAHHCIALKTASQHRISGELHEAGYDPNDGSNCIWLPYSRLQFVRARAYSKALQKHRGGHTDQYFKTVEKHIDRVPDNVAKKFCVEDKKTSKQKLLRYIKAQEKSVWMGVASASDVAYHLYNASFLDPKDPWGTYEEEKGKTKADFIGEPVGAAQQAVDDAAESDSAEDPE
jgi:hypothetical protein